MAGFLLFNRKDNSPPTCQYADLEMESFYTEEQNL